MTRTRVVTNVTVWIDLTDVEAFVHGDIPSLPVGRIIQHVKHRCCRHITQNSRHLQSRTEIHQNRNEQYLWVITVSLASKDVGPVPTWHPAIHLPMCTHPLLCSHNLDPNHNPNVCPFQLKIDSIHQLLLPLETVGVDRTNFSFSMPLVSELGACTEQRDRRW